jgi:hypothetical protein
MKIFLAYTLIVIGALTLLLAIITGVTAAIALIARIRHGPGIMFADVEILVLFTLFLVVVGVPLLWLGRMLNRRTNPDIAQ